MQEEAKTKAAGTLLTQALGLHQAGKLDQAEVYYRRALAQDAQHYDVLRHLGILKAQTGQHAEALEYLRAALTSKPQSGEAYLLLGQIQADIGQFEAALESCDNALELMPRHAQTHYCRGNVLQALKRYEEALVSYDQAMALAPSRPEVLANRGNTLHDLKRYDEALQSYDQALALMPGVAMLYNNRGNTLRELHRLSDALESMDKALLIDPHYVDALINRGNVLNDLSRHEEALICFDKVLAGHPDFYLVHNYRGNVLHDLRRYEDAVASYGRALSIKPDFAEALHNQGNVMMDMGRFEETSRSFERLLACGPEWGHALGKMFHSRLHCCNWEDYAQTLERVVHKVRDGTRTDMPLPFLAVSQSASEQMLCARVYAEYQRQPFHNPLWGDQRYSHERIRVAYLSADFREHAVAYLMAGVFEEHDRSRFETIGISFRSEDPGVTGRRVKAAFDRFEDVSRITDKDVAVMMREQEIDIAVDLMGFTSGCRTTIFAYRPTPIQINYLGFPGTMGADYFDYILADRFVIPEETRACYSETVVYLPDSFQANDGRRKISDNRWTRAEVGLPESGFVFCSFNNSYKLNPPFFDVWMRLLRAVPGSVLWLVADNALVQNNLRAEAAKREVDPARLVFAPRLPYADHLARLQLAELFLDTLPFNAGTTASDALWAGVPVLTCSGNAFASRMAGSLLRALDLPELITHSLQEYEALALKLALDHGLLANIRSKLARNRTTQALFDTKRFTRHLEAAYLMMWERYQRGELPDNFSVQPA